LRKFHFIGGLLSTGWKPDGFVVALAVRRWTGEILPPAQWSDVLAAMMEPTDH
jgi:hypothetical protein